MGMQQVSNQVQFAGLYRGLGMDAARTTVLATLLAGAVITGCCLETAVNIDIEPMAGTISEIPEGLKVSISEEGLILFGEMDVEQEAGISWEESSTEEEESEEEEEYDPLKVQSTDLTSNH